MMVHLNRLINDTVRWKSIPIKFKNPWGKILSGKRCMQYIKSLYLSPTLIPTDRIQCDIEINSNWTEIDCAPKYEPNTNEINANVMFILTNDNTSILCDKSISKILIIY